MWWGHRHRPDLTDLSDAGLYRKERATLTHIKARLGVLIAPSIAAVMNELVSFDDDQPDAVASVWFYGDLWQSDGQRGNRASAVNSGSWIVCLVKLRHPARFIARPESDRSWIKSRSASLTLRCRRADCNSYRSPMHRAHGLSMFNGLYVAVFLHFLI